MILWLDVAFPKANISLAGVGFTQYKNDGTAAAARTTVGVVELGGGAYGALVTIHKDAAGISWDTGDSPITAYANEDYTMLKPVFNRRKWDKTADTITLYESDGVTVERVFDLNNADSIEDITPQ